MAQTKGSNAFRAGALAAQDDIAGGHGPSVDEAWSDALLDDWVRGTDREYAEFAGGYASVHPTGGR